MNSAPSITWLDKLLIAVFAIALLAPVAFFKPDEQAAAAEKRTLAPAPTLPRAKTDLLAFPEVFNKWFSDHFGFRQAFIKTHSRVSFFVLRTSPSPKVILGKKNWLYYNGKAARDGDTIADYRGVPPLSFAALERWRWAFQDQHDWLTAQGLHHLIALIPAKEIIYPDHMPDRYPRLGPPTIEQVSTYLRNKTNIPIINTADALREASKTVLTYHPNDTHWNAYGAFIGYRTIMEEVAKIYPQCAPRREDEFKREELDGNGGDLAVMIHVDHNLPQHYVYMNTLFQTNATYTFLSDDEMAEQIASTGNTNLPRVAILRDSFTEAMLGYLSEHFEKAHYQWSRIGFEASLLERIHPDMVIQIISDRAFRKSRRYPVMMHQESIARRFENAELVLPMNTASLRPAAGTSIEHATIADPAKPPLTDFDAPAEQGQVLPIIQFTVVSDLHRDIIATWNTIDPDQEGETSRRAPPFQLQPGTNVFCLSLVDPDIISPITIQWGRHPGRVEMLKVEMRGVPR